jgi:Ca2+/Na+ antiporter
MSKLIFSTLAYFVFAFVFAFSGNNIMVNIFFIVTALLIVFGLYKLFKKDYKDENKN